MTRNSMKLIGSVPAADEIDDVIGGMSSRELVFLEGRGVPVEWVPWAHALRWDFPPRNPLPDSPIELVVGGQAPPRTLREIEAAVESGLELRLSLPDGFDLRELESVISKVRYLSLGSTGRLTGREVFDSAENLVQLIVGCEVLGATPSAPLPNLERALISRSLIEVACTSPSLRELQVDMASRAWPADCAIAGPVDYLEIERAGKVSRVPSLLRPVALKTLRIYGARELDLTSIAAEVDLEWMEVYRTKLLKGIERVVAMPSLRQLSLERVAAIPGAEAIRTTGARLVAISKSDPVAERAARGAPR